MEVDHGHEDAEMRQRYAEAQRVRAGSGFLARRMG